MAAIEFLTATGHMCTGQRQEFILLSDTLGASMVVDLISHHAPDGVTESTVFGPFSSRRRTGLPMGGNIAASDTSGLPTITEGRVLTPVGHPIANAGLDV